MIINWRVVPHRLLMILLGIAVVIAIASLLSEYLVTVMLAPEIGSIRADMLDLLSVNLEESLPTWYSSTLLVVAATLFLLIAVAKYREGNTYRHYWIGLVVLFIYLSMDEGAAIHEIASGPLHRTFNTSGFLTFGWQIAAVPILVVLGLIYLRFFWHLPTKTRNLLFLSAGIYAGGALVIEGFSAAIYDVQDISFTYLTVATLEEFAEIVGVSLVIYTLCDYIIRQGYRYQLFSEEEQVSSKVNKHARIPISLIIVCVVTVYVGLLAIAWQWGDDTPIDVVEVELPFYHSIDADLVANDVTVFELPEIFSVNSGLTREIAYDLLAYHEQVTIVALPSEEHSMFFAGAVLPFDNDILADLLHANGIVEFIIYETEVVRVFTASLDS